MWMLMLALASLAADDRTPCEKALHSPRWRSGVFVRAKPDCRREQAELPGASSGRLCRSARATLQLPDPWDPERVFVHVAEPREFQGANRDDPSERQSLSYQNAWIEPGSFVELRTGTGQRVRMPVQERAQADDMAAYEGLFWKIRVKLAEADLRALRSHGWDGWSFEVHEQRFTHFVKKAKRFERAVDCVLDGKLP